jgi:hypothetical protein
VGHPGPPALDPSAAAFPGARIPRGPHNAIWKAVYDGGYQDKRFRFHFGTDGVAHFRYSDDEHGTRVAVFKAVPDGIEAWMWLEPKREVPGAFLVQQCLRYSGAGNTPKRRQTAYVPHLSEYDLWDAGDMRSLSYVRQGGAWRRIDPLTDYAAQSEVKRAWEYVSRRQGGPSVFFTPPGARLAEGRGRTVEKALEVPHGLVVRESADGRTVSGMYWERSAEVSVHHPADCLHSSVDLGPTSPARPRIVRGKIYSLAGTKDDLLSRWTRDFPG